MERVRFIVLPRIFLRLTGISSARIFFGRSAVMAKALGTTPEEEHRLGLHKLAKVRSLSLANLPSHGSHRSK